MSKSISEIKETANELAKRSKLGQTDLRALTTTVNDLVNHIHAVTADSEATKSSTPAPTPNKATPVAAPATTPSVADVVAPGRKRRRGVQVGDQTPAAPAVTVGTPAANPAPTKEVATDAEPGVRIIPHRLKAGRGVTVGQQSPINTGVTVGSAPVNPAGQVTVGGRPRK